MGSAWNWFIIVPVTSSGFTGFVTRLLVEENVVNQPIKSLAWDRAPPGTCRGWLYFQPWWTIIIFISGNLRCHRISSCGINRKVLFCCFSRYLESFLVMAAVLFSTVHEMYTPKGGPYQIIGLCSKELNDRWVKVSYGQSLRPSWRWAILGLMTSFWL
jgi:hypothetical protein